MTESLPAPSPYSSIPPVAQDRRFNGVGLAALIVGGVALLLSFIPFVNYVSGFLAAIGLILGIVGLALRGRRKGVAIAGTIVSAAALVLSIVLAIVYTGLFASAVKKSVDDEKAAANTPVTLVYEVTGDGRDATIDYTSFTDDNEGSEQVTDAKLPFTKTLTVKRGGDFDFTSYVLSATNGLTGHKIGCSITLDGKVVSKHQGSGKFATVSCSYSK